MYPRVKVREEENDEDQYDFEMKSLQSLKGLQFISLDDLSSPEDSPACIVKIPRLSSSNTDIPSVFALKGESREKRQNNPENNRTNIRASPVLRPRAVLSSPDNDGVRAHKIKQGEELLSGLKNQCQNRHSQCTKSLPVAVRVRKELKEVTDSGALDGRSKPPRVVVKPDHKRADKSKSKSDRSSNNKTATVLIK